MPAYSFKARFVAPICVGLGIDILRVRGLVIPAGVEIKPKRQTIRAHGKRRHARPGETVQLYRGMRTKQCFKIGDARCIDVSNVIIWVTADAIAIERSKLLLGAREMAEFAQQDGFAGPADMAAFWREEHPGIEKFEGVLIKWEPING